MKKIEITKSPDFLIKDIKKDVNEIKKGFI